MNGEKKIITEVLRLTKEQWENIELTTKLKKFGFVLNFSIEKGGCAYSRGSYCTDHHKRSFENTPEKAKPLPPELNPWFEFDRAVEVYERREKLEALALEKSKAKSKESEGIFDE